MIYESNGAFLPLVFDEEKCILVDFRKENTTEFSGAAGSRV